MCCELLDSFSYFHMIWDGCNTIFNLNCQILKENKYNLIQITPQNTLVNNKHKNKTIEKKNNAKHKTENNEKEKRQEKHGNAI